MITSAIKKKTDCCTISLNPYMVFQTWKSWGEKKESNSIVSLYCWCQLLDQSLLLYANIVFNFYDFLLSFIHPTQDLYKTVPLPWQLPPWWPTQSNNHQQQQQPTKTWGHFCWRNRLFFLDQVTPTRAIIRTVTWHKRSDRASTTSGGATNMRDADINLQFQNHTRS